MAREQLKDSQLQNILVGSCPISLVLQPLPVGPSPVTLHCDVLMDRIRPFVPKMFRQEICNNLHARVRASLKMVAEKYVWPLMRQDVVLWARTCLQCSCAKVSRHTKSEIGKFELPSSRFEHVHIDLVGPLPPSEGFRYCLTCVDRFSKWPEAFPLVEISAEAMANTFYTGWISTFDSPLRFTTDQGTQFEASLFDALLKFLGTEWRYTTPYHPAANGQVERFHRQLKAAIMEGPYKVVDRTEKVFWISRHGKEVSVNIDRLKPAYVPKKLEGIPVEANMKKKASLQPEEVPDSGQEKPRRSSRQETTTHSGRKVRFNPKCI
ncbi:transposon Ty3-I Gag-Pol polyprotein [Nephila pilipes]|uniref:RNA-directed DNA polymerase n=1 Tax=Nephila pilipes TaxID=299642 RepID=A0A8X6TCH1_NEPPI|nr:transposon Ty3-I Gag-Pol polyprotein [Nephila pilipes]